MRCSSLCDLCWEGIENLDDTYFLWSKFRLRLYSLGRMSYTLGISLTEDRLDSCMSVLDERTGVTVEVNRLLRIEEHCLSWVNLEDEVLQCTEADHLEERILLILAEVVDLSKLE